MKWLQPGPHPLGEIVMGLVFALFGIVIGFIFQAHFRGALDSVPSWVIGGFLLLIGAFFIEQGIRGLLSRNKS